LIKLFALAVVRLYTVFLIGSKGSAKVIPDVIEKPKSQSTLLSWISQLVSLLLMSLAIYACAGLLTWTVNKKSAAIQQSEPSVITAKVRDRQLQCLARNIYHEAGTEPFEGKVAVAQVAINRSLSGRYPEDICRVIYQKNIFYEKTVCQFSWYCDRSAMNRPLNQAQYNESMEVAKRVLLEGFRLPGLTTAMYYHADYVNPGWKLQPIAKIGRHIFYRD